MNWAGYLLADDILGLEEAFAGWRSMNPSTLGGVLLVVAIGLVTLLALVWAVFFRKRRRHRRSRHHSHRRSSGSLEPVEILEGEPSDAPPPEERSGRHSRRRHRARNPTLAETGGLPPVRTAPPPEPQS